LWPLILDFVEKHFGEEDLAAFKKYFELSMDHTDDPLVKAGGLGAMIGTFLKHNKDAYKQFRKHQSKGKSDSDAKSKSKKKRAESGATEDDSEDAAKFKKSEKKREKKQADKKRRRSSTATVEDASEKPKQKRARVSSVASTEGPMTRRKS